MESSSSNKMVIAIDGPAGSGKSTVAREVASRLGIHYLDSGAFYRALTLALYREYQRQSFNLEFTEWAETRTSIDLGEISIQLEFGEGNENHIFLNGEDVSSEIRLPEITDKIKYVADKAIFRDFVNNLIRNLAKDHSLAMDGRDIGTIVFPNTPYKFFLTASPEVRAKRRLDELNSKGIAADYESVYQDMVKRDYSDENRKIAPLVRSKDALLVDTDSLSIKVVIETILSGVSNVSS